MSRCRSSLRTICNINREVRLVTIYIVKLKYDNILKHCRCVFNFEQTYRVVQSAVDLCAENSMNKIDGVIYYSMNLWYAS